MLEKLLSLENNGGFTLKNGKPVNYRTGFQVATAGRETRDARTAARFIKEYDGNCGVWYSNGVYYVDKSHWEKTKRAALECGRAHAQQSILKWSDKSLVWC